MSNTKIINIYPIKNTQNRDVELIIANSIIKNSSNLSDFDLDSIIKIITELTQVVNGTLDSMYWGQEQIMIDSEKVNSVCFYDTNNENLGSVSTQALLKLMIEIRDFKQHYQNSNNLKNVVGQAFNAIKSDPNNYKRFPNSDFHFIVTINDIYITLILNPEDFNLSQNEYTNQLQTIF